jgi:phosphatidylglycerol---prolipoprotein diacylglyceryl transferase
MIFLLNYYQHLPEIISSVALRVSSFTLGWYPIMYIIGFVIVFFLLQFRKRETTWKEIIQNSKFKTQNYNPKFENELILDFLIYSFWGLVIGARLGYIIFYNLPHYLANPWEIISPFDAAGKFIGLYGMSYHGGLIGVIIATWLFARKNRINFWSWADFAVPAIPAGFFFGRIGNFLNGELYGRITTRVWGMYFPASPLNLRHPSQLYEAFFEGIVLFVILWSIRNGVRYKNKVLHVSCFMLYVFLYGFLRFFLEFFREPDPQLGFILKWAENGLTMGQILSLGMVIFSVFAFLYPVRSKN